MAYGYITLLHGDVKGKNAMRTDEGKIASIDWTYPELSSVNLFELYHLNILSEESRDNRICEIVGNEARKSFSAYVKSAMPGKNVPLDAGAVLKVYFDLFRLYNLSMYNPESFKREREKLPKIISEAEEMLR